MKHFTSYYARMKVKNPMFVILPSVAFVAGLAIFSYVYLAQYFMAIAWHLRHGNHTVIRGYRVSVPLLWRREDYYGGNIGLIRAGFGDLLSSGNGAIEWYPAANRQLVATEDQAVRAAQRAASHPVFPGESGEVISVMTLRRAQDTMYCVREEVPYFSSLDCYLAGATVIFRYSGQPEFEKDAESILSSMY